ncbi:MAG: apolipoprotein N-acyltransferase [Bacteroidota bacterium]|nr:apolipoprotein N-acyltransferase [Bacteroidota bacterium]
MRRKKSYFLSLASGILLSLPWLFPSLGWVLFFSFVPLMMAEDQLSTQNDPGKSSFYFPSLVAFIVWNALSTWWISYVSFVGMMIVALMNAVLMAGIWWLMHVIRRRFSIRTGYFSLIVFWIAFEFLQHHWAIQWPWLTLGNGFSNLVKIIQWYEFTGVLGGSLWVLLSNILIFFAAKNLSGKLFLKSLRWTGLAIIVVFLPLSGSICLYSNYSEKGIVQEVLVLQPNIDPYTEKFSGMSSEEQFSKLLSMVESNLSDSIDIILAPETSLPPMCEDSVLNQNQSLTAISKIIQRYPNVSFIAGALTQRKFGKGEALSETARPSADGSYYYDIFNSALMIDRTPGVQISHKSILVSGVEKMPFQKYFSILGKYVLQLGGTSGSLAAAIEPGLFLGKGQVKIGPVICFESAFGEHCGQLVKRGATLLVVMTNDGWWKDSPGTGQHFNYSRLRAVETRRSIARCANTGLSGFINQRGDVLKMTSLDSCEVIQSRIRINDKITFYATHGDYIGRICLVLSGLIALYILVIWWMNRR